MSENKTAPTDASVSGFVAAVENRTRRADAETLLAMMGRISGKDPVMWGDTLIGFGQYHFKYDSGREGDMFRIGFSPRKANLAIYIMPGFDGYQDILARLGKHKTGACCLYITRLANVDPEALEEIVTAAHRDIMTKYPEPA